MHATVLLSALVLALGCGPPNRGQRTTSSPTPLWVHPGGCEMCHGDFPGTLPAHGAPVAACTSSGCHDHLVAANERVHAPVLTGDCRWCHETHASAEPALRRAPDGELCATCHPQLITCPMAGELEPVGCTTCHSPHGGGEHFLVSRP